jgi:hypothetical protein
MQAGRLLSPLIAAASHLAPKEKPSRQLLGVRASGLSRPRSSGRQSSLVEYPRNGKGRARPHSGRPAPQGRRELGTERYAPRPAGGRRGSQSARTTSCSRSSSVTWSPLENPLIALESASHLRTAPLLCHLRIGNDLVSHPHAPERIPDWHKFLPRPEDGTGFVFKRMPLV